MNAGYTCTTITSGPEEPVRIGVSFYLDDAARIRVYGLDNDRPQFSITHGEVDVTFLMPHGPVTEDHARIARELADKAAVYAVDIERLRAEHDAKAAADTAA